jgi:hypothetical protein
MRRLDPSVDVGDNDPAVCPYCGSDDTQRDHPKGPSLCRSIHYCNACEEPFEAMA